MALRGIQTSILLVFVYNIYKLRFFHTNLQDTRHFITLKVTCFTMGGLYPFIKLTISASSRGCNETIFIQAITPV